MTRIARAAALALVTVAALAGCVRYDIEMTLAEDNTASGTFILAVQEGAAEALGAESDEALLDEMLQTDDLGPGFSEEPFAEDDWTGKKYTFDSVPIGDLAAFGDLFTVTREDDTFVVAGTVAPAVEGDTSMVDGGAQSSLTITFPGEVTDHNGTLEGKSVTWDLLTTTEPISATGGATSGGLPLGLIAGIVGGVVVLAGVAVVVIVALRKRDAAAADGAQEGATSDEAAPAPVADAAGEASVEEPPAS